MVKVVHQPRYFLKPSLMFLVQLYRTNQIWSHGALRVVQRSCLGVVHCLAHSTVLGRRAFINAIADAKRAS